MTSENLCWKYVLCIIQFGNPPKRQICQNKFQFSSNSDAKPFEMYSEIATWACWYASPDQTWVQDLVLISDRTSYRKISWSLEAEIGVSNCLIALKVDRHPDSTAVGEPVKFRSNTLIPTTNLADSRSYKTSCRILKLGPVHYHDIHLFVFYNILIPTKQSPTKHSLTL